MEVRPSTFEENLEKSQFAHAWEYTMKTSEGKAIDVAHKQKACILISYVSVVAAKKCHSMRSGYYSSAFGFLNTIDTSKPVSNYYVVL